MLSQSWLNFLQPARWLELPASLRLFLAVFSAALLSFSFRGSHPSIYSWFCPALLLLAVLGARRWVAFLSGFLHGLVFVITTVPWIAETLSVHGGMSTLAGWGVLLLIASVWGCAIGLFGLAVRALDQRSIDLALFGAPFLWICTEVFRTYLPEISFPWALLGYPAAGNPALVQLTTVTSIYGISFLIVAFNSLLLWTFLGGPDAWRRRLPVLSAAIVMLVAVNLIGPRFVPLAPASHLARVVQPNFPEQMEYPGDWYEGHKAEMAELQELSLRSSHDGRHPDLLIWPEAPAPFSFQDPRFGPMITALTQKFGHDVIAGVIEWKPAPKNAKAPANQPFVPYNSAAVLNPLGQPVFSYDKVHLVPFGEYEPFPLIHQVVTSVSEEVGGFRKGKEHNVGQFSNGRKFGIFICYEAIYPGEIREYAKKGAELLINISNDGWFGTSEAAEQHLRMARVRAVENRRWLVRDTNSGITASIDPYGNITRVMRRDSRDSADLPYDYRSDTTFYARFGDWFAWMCVLVSAILLVSLFRKVK